MPCNTHGTRRFHRLCIYPCSFELPLQLLGLFLVSNCDRQRRWQCIGSGRCRISRTSHQMPRKSIALFYAPSAHFAYCSIHQMQVGHSTHMPRPPNGSTKLAVARAAAGAAGCRTGQVRTPRDFVDLHSGPYPRDSFRFAHAPSRSNRRRARRCTVVSRAWAVPHITCCDAALIVSACVTDAAAAFRIGGSAAPGAVSRPFWLAGV